MLDWPACTKPDSMAGTNAPASHLLIFINVSG
jgi:hypothetical protein